MRCKSLVVFYEQDDANGDKSKSLTGGRSRAPAASSASSGWKRAAAWW